MRLAEQGYKSILLNLRDVRHIDSAGVGELMSCYTSVRNRGGQFKLMNLSKNVHNLLQITKLYTIFEVEDDEPTAVASFRIRFDSGVIRFPRKPVPKSAPDHCFLSLKFARRNERRS